jgi:hypothetical protein
MGENDLKRRILAATQFKAKRLFKRLLTPFLRLITRIFIGFRKKRRFRPKIATRQRAAKKNHNQIMLNTELLGEF